MNNIFENAYFGKAYKTRDGRKAIFYVHHNAFARERANFVEMILEGENSIYRWFYDGEAGDKKDYLDIVSEWEESTNEEELDDLAEIYALDIDKIPFEWFTKERIKTMVKNAYMAGYKAAMKGE